MRQNDTANTTSSETDKPWSVFSPQTAKSRDSLDLPGSPTSITVYSSPVTAITQLSLQGPNMPEETGTTTQDSTSITVAPSPIVQPSDNSLLVPVTTTTTTPGGPSVITSAATAHIEHSATDVVPPGSDTTSQSRAPKMPHTEIGRTDLDQPSKPTDQPSTGDQDGNSGSETTAEPHTQAGAILPGATGSAQSGSGNADQQSGGSGNDAGPHASPTFVIGNTPLIAGGSPVTVDGTTYSLASTGAAVVINGNTIAFTTNTQGQAVPAETAADNGSSDDSTGNALGGLSTASASATSGGASSQETGSTEEQQSTGAATSTTSTTRNNAGATTTTGSSAPAVQSDSAGASNLQTWPITAIVGAIGFLAMVV